MTDTIFPTGFTRLTSVSTAFTVYADNGTANGYITVGDVIGLAPVQSVAGRTGAVTLTTSDVLGLTAMATLATAAQGSVVYMGASGPAVLAPGTSGFVLQTNGASANPSWIALGGGGTITGVTAGTGLSGGGSSGTVTVTLVQAATGALGGVTFSATNPAAPGSATPGTATSAARSDHVHPLPPNVSSGAAGLAPASGGGTTNFLRADGSWAAPPGGGSSNLTISNIYTATGAIALSDTLAIVNSSSQCDMTLALPTTDGQRLRVKRYGSGTVTVTLKLDGAAGSVITLSSPTVKEAVELVGVVANGTLGTTWMAI